MLATRHHTWSLLKPWILIRSNINITTALFYTCSPRCMLNLAVNTAIDMSPPAFSSLPSMNSLDSNLLERICDCSSSLTRFKSVVLINKAFAKAAAAAEVIELEYCSQQQLSGFWKWLQRHGAQLRQLRLYGSLDWQMQITQTDLGGLTAYAPNLNVLQVSTAVVQLSRGGGVVAGPWTSLTRLVLSNCVLVEGDWSAVADLTSLQHLQLTCSKRRQMASGHAPPTLEPDQLQQLQQLTHLTLKHVVIQDDALQHITGLGRLQELRLSASFSSAAAFEGLQQPVLPHLTLLEVCRDWYHQQMPGQDQPAAAPMEAALLSGCTSLLHLRLVDSPQASLAALGGVSQITYLNISCSNSVFVQQNSTPQMVADTLQILSGLPHLGLLNMRNRLQQEAPLDFAYLYANITCSSNLQHLDLRDCILPGSAWQHLFGAGRRLQHLTVLLLPWMPGVLVDESGWGTFAGCCPVLQTLQLGCRLLPAVNLEPLRHLQPTLQSLHISSCTDSCIPAWVLYMTKLQHLELEGESAGFNQPVLRQLTVLTQLTSLSVACSRRTEGPVCLNLRHQVGRCGIQYFEHVPRGSRGGQPRHAPVIIITV